MYTMIWFQHAHSSFGADFSPILSLSLRFHASICIYKFSPLYRFRFVSFSEINLELYSNMHYTVCDQIRTCGYYSCGQKFIVHFSSPNWTKYIRPALNSDYTEHIAMMNSQLESVLNRQKFKIVFVEKIVEVAYSRISSFH